MGNIQIKRQKSPNQHIHQTRRGAFICFYQFKGWLVM
jgi:hypothetical protein